MQHSQFHLLEQLPLSLCTYPFFTFCPFVFFLKTGFGSGLPIFINSGVSLNLKVITQQVSIPRLNPIKSAASTNFAISPFCFEIRISFLLRCRSPFYFISTGTVEFIKYGFLSRKSFSPLLFLGYLLSSSIGNPHPHLVQSETILSFLYLQFNIDGYIRRIYVSLLIVFPMQFGILERSILFFVRASIFTKQSAIMSHYL